MAFDPLSGSTAEGEPGSTCTSSNVQENPQLTLIRNILGHHDADGIIAFQVIECIERDGVTLQLLSEFDDTSLNGLIDSWNLNTFSKNKFLIRGVIINGIKQLRNAGIDTSSSSQNTSNTSSTNNNNPSSAASGSSSSVAVSSTTNVISEAEMKAYEKLTNYEIRITNKINTFETETKSNDEIKNVLYVEYLNELESKLNKLSENIIKRRGELCDKLNEIFSQTNQLNAKNLDNLKLIKEKIQSVKNEYNQNLNQLNQADAISKRTLLNTTRINSFLNEHKENDEFEINSKYQANYECSISFDNEIITQIDGLIANLGAIRQVRVENTVIIDKVKVLDTSTNAPYKFNILKILNNGCLTVKKYDPITHTGGILRLQCKELILESGGSINVTGKGYPGGNRSYYQGYSYKYDAPNLPTDSVEPNLGGGGGAWGGWGAGGGGYGTPGKSGFCHGEPSGKAGLTYGDRDVSVVYCGSGGGNSKFGFGSAGGGGIMIECEGNIRIENGATIIANGGDLKQDSLNGCGSGGTIWIRAKEVKNDGLISAVGGINKNGKGGDGVGGMGRIRIAGEIKSSGANGPGGKIEPQVDVSKSVSLCLY